MAEPIYFDEDSKRVSINDSGTEGGEFLMRMSTRYNLKIRDVMAFMSDVQEELDGSSRNDSRCLQLLPLLDRVCSFLATLKLIPTDCLVFLLRNGRMIGCESQREIVVRHGKDPDAKANVSKWMKKIQRRTGLKPAPGMRRNVEAMRRSRIKQLKKRK